ncbi:UreD urease accessory protein-domain-containing protein [Suillus discolor]|uniref:UreD urease accessory protein-domain-containing protein n=1 Tax=Suillus discolor TaxID=1912936 RepID=A0A9P7FKM3_9AGAM|nr:UreD urease accessory protein-domain-containing protein [Suillus discolor]KAG2120746.1 UreD urease accessory protein-domain-containing protein [Suillus discolor]
MSSTTGESIPVGTGHITCDLHSSTVVFSKLSSSYPLKLLSPRVAEHGVAIVYVMSYGGGLVGGDCMQLVVEVGKECKLLLLSQGSTKVFKTRAGNRASTRFRTSSQPTPSSLSLQAVTTQSMEVTIAPDSALFLLPDPVTCFRSASYTQAQTFHLAGSASIVLLDWVTSGRKSMDEEWDFLRYYSVNEVFVEGRRVARDVLLLDNSSYDTQTASESCLSNPTTRPPPRTLKNRLAPYSCYAMLLLYGPQTHGVVTDLQAKYRTISIFKRATPERFLWSLTPVDDGKGTVVRAAGVDTEDVKNWFKEVLRGLEAVVGINEYRKAFL